MSAASVPALPIVSVVVCTHRRPEKLAACLDALARQTIADRAEIVVVDDGPDDRAAEVARRHGVHLVRHTVNRGLSNARNTGIDAARAPVVAFTDDDCLPAPDWLEHLVTPYTDPAVVGVGGGVTAFQRTRLVHRYLADTNRLAPLEIELGASHSIGYRARLYLRRNLRPAEERPRLRPVFSLVGANMSFRRDALVSIGGFDGRITFGGEDEDICRRLHESVPDGRLVHHGGAVIEHDYDGELSDALRRSYMYGKGGARSYLKNPEQNPTLFPAPPLVAALVLAGMRRPRLLALAVAVPLLVFGRWSVGAVRERRWELLAYPFLQLLDEAAHDVGFLRSWVRLRREYRGAAEAATGRLAGAGSAPAAVSRSATTVAERDAMMDGAFDGTIDGAMETVA